MDKKSRIILALIAVIVFLVVYILASKYNQTQLQRQQTAFEEGFRQGGLNEQRNAISQVQAVGVYTITVIDEKNKTQLIKLAPLSGNSIFSSGNLER
ncbi:MAG: hypothetical protein AABX90_03860 [Nanoarchaeota archaeon]